MYDDGSTNQLQLSDVELATDLAHRAGELLVMRQHSNTNSSSSGWALAQDADEEANSFLVDELTRARPNDSFLTEESPDDLSRLESNRTWIIDPLDGSGGFGYGAVDWAVHVALTEAGQATAGAVAVPAMNTTFSTESVSMPDSVDRRPIVVVGRSRVLTDGRAITEALGGELNVCSSAGVKAMLVVNGEADVYVHSPSLYEWDVCAPAAVATAAGLAVTDRLGREFRFNEDSEPIVDGFVVCRPRLLAEVLSALA